MGTNPTGARDEAQPSSIDFSDLSTEYIGILYKGLLDVQCGTPVERIGDLGIG